MLQPTTTRRPPVSAIIGLGANLSSDHSTLIKTLQDSLDMLVGDGVEIQAVSRFYSTPCFPAGAGPDYVNAVALLRAEVSAADLLSRLHTIEETMGRERTERWGQRVLDLDLLAFGDEIAPDLEAFSHWRDLPIPEQSTIAPEQLILPHPRLQDRAFVLVPMAEVAPGWVHPVTGRSTRQMLGDLDAGDVAQIVPL
ncbi:MAG: 2-amino-4-hydroxy-6-hydroxymethyldihydropteridine diphosphokinase [Marinosulfonomonas sp.]|nr:MAG: 2-amino-4-hydroxy-6-hydroxymethyldihydropteridine diphosphokinase [Marinosulfonomonas sp.]